MGRPGNGQTRGSRAVQQFNKPIMFDVLLFLNLYGADPCVRPNGPVVNRCGGNATIIDGNAPFRAFRGLADDDDGTCLGGVKSGVLKKDFAKVGRNPQATTY